MLHILTSPWRGLNEIEIIGSTLEGPAHMSSLVGVGWRMVLLLLNIKGAHEDAPGGRSVLFPPSICRKIIPKTVFFIRT